VHGEEAYPTEELVRVGAGGESEPARAVRSDGQGTLAEETVRQME